MLCCPQQTWQVLPADACRGHAPRREDLPGLFGESNDGERHMDALDRNLGLTPLLRAVTFIEVIVLFGAGFGLFFLPDLARELWPWPPAPFNTRFLGSIYLTALLPVAVMLIAGRWAPARGEIGR